jgi:hypothetical protein
VTQHSKTYFCLGLVHQILPSLLLVFTIDSLGLFCKFIVFVCVTFYSLFDISLTLLVLFSFFLESFGSIVQNELFPWTWVINNTRVLFWPKIAAVKNCSNDPWSDFLYVLKSCLWLWHYIDFFVQPVTTLRQRWALWTSLHRCCPFALLLTQVSSKFILHLLIQIASLVF